LRIGEALAVRWSSLDLDLDQAGLTARATADQLGHAKVSMTTDHYSGRRTRATGAATVLEVLGGARAQDDSQE